MMITEALNQILEAIERSEAVAECRLVDEDGVGIAELRIDEDNGRIVVVTQ